MALLGIRVAMLRLPWPDSLSKLQRFRQGTVAHPYRNRMFCEAIGPDTTWEEGGSRSQSEPKSYHARAAHRQASESRKIKAKMLIHFTNKRGAPPKIIGQGASINQS